MHHTMRDELPKTDKLLPQSTCQTIESQRAGQSNNNCETVTKCCDSFQPCFQHLSTADTGNIVGQASVGIISRLRSLTRTRRGGHMTASSKLHDSRVLRPLHSYGIKYQGLRWNSLAFQKLRDQLGPVSKVTLRFDPRDPSRAWIYDWRRDEWIEGYSESN